MPVKVECESCKAPYTIDERRIPASGLRVRCPKCTKTFVVKKPGEPAPASAKTATGVPGVPGGDSLAQLPAQAPPSTPQSSLPPSVDASDLDLPAVAGAPDALLPSPVTRPAPPKKPVIKGTALGLGGLVPGVVSAAGAQAKPPAEPDLPAVRGGGAKPSAELDLPATRGAPARPEADLPATRAPTTKASFGEIDLPARAAPKPAAKGSFDIDLPSVSAAKPPAAPPRVQAKTQKEFDDLPAPAMRADLPLPKTRADLPAPRADLPAPRADLPAFAKKTGEQPTRPELPAQRAPQAKNTKMEFGEIDLPAVQPAGRDLPSPRAAATQQFGEIDLPAVQPAGRDLPSPRAAATQQFGEIDLPSMAPGGGHLPAVRGPGADLPDVARGGSHLPAVRGAGADLPDLVRGGGHLPAVRGSGADLPDLAPAGAHLPAVAATAANLPAIRRDDDFGMREPSVAMPAPPDFGRDFAVAQTMVGPGIQSSAPSDSSGFGELELPGPGGDPWGAPAPPEFGLRSGTARGFGEVDLGPSPKAATGLEAHGVTPPSIAPPMGSPTGSSDFGELELPGPGAGMGASPSAETFGGNTGGLSLDSYGPPGGGPSIGTEANIPGKLDSRSTGGMGFGEVDLGGGGSNDDALEFGAIPEEKRVEGLATDGAAYEAPVTKPREKVEAPAAEEERKPSRVGRVVLALFAAAVIGGGMLEFNDRLGAFGRKAIADKVNADKHAGMLSTAVKRTREALGDDSVPRANDAVTELQKDTSVAPRYTPLVAYLAYAQFAHEVRFGKDPQRDSLARSALAKVPDASSEKTLAEAARDVVAGQFPAARGALKSLTADAQNVDAWVTLGELELRDKKPKDAVVAFTSAVKARDDARTRSGLMRAYEAAGEPEKAKAEATTIAAKYPNHATSRLLLARAGWEREKDEKEAMKWLSDLEKPAILAAAAPMEQVDAMTLRGNIHLDRGRVSSAKKAFDDAIVAAKGNPTPAPRLGLGEVHLANGQFPNAISEFSLASQAIPDAALPKIGIARAYLRQEKPTEAKAQLANLKDPLLAGEIGFWLGQAEEKLTPERPVEAIKIYEVAIKTQPSEVKPYIALANLQAKIGKMDEADATLGQAAKNVPPSERLHIGIGELRFRQERYTDALEHFKKALELQPANLEALYSKGKTLLRMGDREKLDEGKKVLDQVKEKDEKYPGLALEYGLYFQKTDQLSAALEQYQAALARDPKDIDIRLSVARAQVEAHIKDAEASLRDILGSCTSSASPEICSTEANHYLGRAILDRGEPAAAKPYLDAAAAKGDNNAQYHLYLGWAFVELNALPDADREVTRALELDKSLGLAHWLRAEIDAKSGKYKEAIESAKRALALSPALSQAYATTAYAQKQLNNEEGALAAYATAIKSDPSNPRAAWWRYQVADIHFHRNAVGRAANELRDAIKQAKGFAAAPAWLPKAHFYLAEALRHSDRAEALKEYREFLATSVGSTDPARKEAQAAVIELAGK